MYIEYCTLSVPVRAGSKNWTFKHWGLDMNMDSAMTEAVSMRAEGKGITEQSRGEYNEKADPGWRAVCTNSMHAALVCY